MSKKAHEGGLDFFLNIPKYSYEADNDTDAGTNLIQVQGKVWVKHIFWAIEEFTKKQESRIQSECNESEKSMRYFLYPPLKCLEKNKNQCNSENIENRKRKERRTQSNNTLLMGVYDWYEWMEGYSIDLPSEEGSKIPKKRRVEKCPYNRIEISKTIFLYWARSHEEYHKKAKNSPKEREMVVFGSEEKTKEFNDITIHKVFQNELFIAPFGEDVSKSSKEEYCECKGNKRSVWEYGFRESFFPWKMMQKGDKEEPTHGDKCSECPDFESEEFYRGIHGGELKVKS